MESFINHPYWENVLAIQDRNQSQIIHRAVTLPVEKKKEFLTLVASGFYPISYSSPLGFSRVAELTNDVQAKEIATNIYEVELGKHPFIKGNWNLDVLHCDQYKLTLASLMDGCEIELPHPSEFSVNRKLDIKNASATLALAVCDVIEHTAPAIIQYVQDFVVQWQYLTSRKSSLVNRTWLDEHNLSEGDTAEDQHIGLIEKMMKPFGSIVESKEYENAKALYNRECIHHLDEVCGKIMELVDIQTSVAA
jgi:hypothetical protein